jgi:Family of unknown function (DUF6401)
MSSHDAAVPLSAVGLRLTDEVGQGVLDWVAAGDLALSSELDQHVATIRAALAACRPDELDSAWQAGQAAHAEARFQAAQSQAARSQAAQSQAMRSQAMQSQATRQHDARRHDSTVTPAIAEVACPDAPFADNPWHANAALPLRLLLHYACGFVEAAVRADWWPGENETATDVADFESVRLAAVCRLVRQSEAAAALPPDLR